MESWLYNPELEMMRWRLQVLAMGLQQQQQTAALQGGGGYPLPFVPFHLQQGQDPLQHGIKQEPQESPQEASPQLLYRPAFQARCGSVSPRAESSSPSSSRSSPSPSTASPSPGWAPATEQSEPLDLSIKPEQLTPATMMLPPAPTTATNQSCNVCNKEYSSPAALNMHMRTHTAGCKCPFCGKSFSRPWLLQGHIRTHTGEKPFTCNLCNKAFADKSNLRAHVQTHSSDKPFSCSKCGKCFALKSYLSKHEESSCLKTERERSNSVSKRPRTSASPLTLPLASSLASPLASSLGSSSASSQLSLTRLLSSPSLLPHSHISAATLQALKMAVFANNKS